MSHHFGDASFSCTYANTDGHFKQASSPSYSVASRSNITHTIICPAAPNSRQNIFSKSSHSSQRTSSLSTSASTYSPNRISNSTRSSYSSPSSVSASHDIYQSSPFQKPSIGSFDIAPKSVARTLQTSYHFHIRECSSGLVCAVRSVWR